MVKIPMNEDDLESLLEEQETRRNERRKQKRLPHINESQLIKPAKRVIESGYCPDTGNITWYEEPNIFIREREPDEPPSRITERPDLLCEWQPKGGGESTLYVIELKKRLNKRGIGQALTYLWATRNGLKIVDGTKEYNITGEEMLILFLGTMEYKTPYYGELLEWVRESIDLGSLAGIEVLPLKPE